MRAVRVERESAEVAISRLGRRGLLDPSRRIVERDGFVEIPVTGTVDDHDSFHQKDPVPRKPELTPTDRMSKSGISEDRVPSGWTRLGSVLLAELDGDKVAAEALLEAHPGATAVVDHRGIDGALRRPEAELLAGDGPTETVHREHGLVYRLDPLRVMFSPGNSGERLRVRSTVQEDDWVLDMFACVGQFSIPAATAGAHVLAIDANPEAALFLRENAALNGLNDRLDVVVADSRRSSPDGPFDRVLMGHLDSPGHLGRAVASLGEGGRLHYHESCPSAIDDRPVKRVRRAVEDGGRDALRLDRRLVKTFAPGVGHYAVDCLVE
ncbi:MAG: tRNA(Phe) (4-demethylwyosine(37)-C(7)) aminocarboxypropyltransferase [Methanonatronarchaeales archaeon]|nr:tRNA(Phe) (4-demethylwyosine(37)-C(7)) aminocarboxypropyltransferase [Methanonatronarchaeales archaeon]